MTDMDATATAVSAEVVSRDGDRGRKWRGLVELGNKRWVQVAVLALLFVITGRLGHLLAIPPGLATPVWLPSGFAFAAVVLFGPRLWPGVFLGACVLSIAQVGEFHSVGAISFTTIVALSIAVAVTSEPLLAGYLYRWFRIEGPLLSRTRYVSIVLLVIAPISCAVAATLASLALVASAMIDWGAFDDTWRTWLIGDLAGIYLIMPALLSWAERGRPKVPPRDRVLAGIWVVCLTLACGISFFDAPPFGAVPSLGFLPFPLLVFVAYRFDDRFASVAGAAVVAVAGVAAANGLGPFAGGLSHESLLALQVYALVGVLTALFTRALANEKATAELAARRLSTELAHVSRVTMMGEIAAGMAHEYHQPLTAIANYASASLIKLKQHRAAYLEIRAPLERITDETHRAAAIVDRVKNFLQKRQPSRTLCNPNEIVGDAIRLTQMAHSFPRVSIQYEPRPNLPSINVDAVQITQVLVNLILNSCEAIEASAAERGEVRIAARLAAFDKLQIDVDDDGPGMDEVASRDCFDQFYSTKEHGLGVGLGISRTLAEAHGGRLYHERSGGPGTRFRLELPLSS